MKRTIVTIIMMMLMATIVSADWENPDVYLSLDDADKNSTHYFDGVASYDAIILNDGGPTLQSVTGAVNEGVLFNATDDSNILEVVGYDPDYTNGYTHCMAFTPNTFNPTGGAYFFGHESTGGADTWNYLSNGQYDIGICDDGCNNGIGYYVDALVTSTTDVSVICFVYTGHISGNSSDLKIYLNGTLLVPNSGDIYDWGGNFTGSDMNFTDTPLDIGGYWDHFGLMALDNLDAMVDEVYLYVGEVSAVGIQSLTDAILAGEQYPFTEPEQPSIRTGGSSGVTALTIADTTPEPTTTDVEPKEKTEYFFDDWSNPQKLIGGIVVAGLLVGVVAVGSTMGKSKPKKRRRRK